MLNVEDNFPKICLTQPDGEMKNLCLDNLGLSKKQRKNRHCVLEFGNYYEMRCHIASIAQFRASSFQKEELTKYLDHFWREREEQLSHSSCFYLCSHSKFSRDQLERLPTERRRWLALLRHALNKPMGILAGEKNRTFLILEKIEVLEGTPEEPLVNEKAPQVFFEMLSIVIKDRCLSSLTHPPRYATSNPRFHRRIGR